MNRKVLAVMVIALVLVAAVVFIDISGVSIPGVTTSSTSSTSSGTKSTGSTTTGSITTGTGIPSNPQNPTSTTTTGGGTGSVTGLDQALAGNSGLNNFLTARNCGLTNIGYVLFCDTFPDNSLDAKKWKSYGNITVTPGNVVFDNATMVSKGGFYYGKFATFRVELNPYRPPRPGQGSCPGGYIYSIGRHACVYDYAVWGFARGSSANAIQWGVYWEQNITSIRSHTRYTDFMTHTQLDEVSPWRPAPSGITEYALNWNVDAHGAYVQFVYKAQNGTIVYFAKHTTAIPKTFLYLFAASNGTHFILHRVIILPAWRNGDIPLISLAVLPNLFQDW